MPNSNIGKDQAGGAVGLGRDYGSGESMVALLKGAAAIQLQLIVAKRECRYSVTTPFIVPRETGNPDFYVKC